MSSRNQQTCRCLIKLASASGLPGLAEMKELVQQIYNSFLLEENLSRLRSLDGMTDNHNDAFILETSVASV